MKRSLNSEAEISFSKKAWAPAILFSVILFAACEKDIKTSGSGDETSANSSDSKKKVGTATVSLFATGLNNPRGLKFGPDGYLYVAEAGLGGTEYTGDQCPELLPFDAPYYGSPTGGRISKISTGGVRTTVTDKLPTTINVYGDILGPVDIAFIENTLYACLYAGCGHSIPGVPSSVVKINPNGSYTLVADISAYRLSHPVANPSTDDHDPDGTVHSMISVGNVFYVTDANMGEVMKITSDGSVSRVVDVSASEGHIVPTELAWHGNLYMGNLGLFPIVDGSSKIFKITPSGNMKVVATGLTSIIGMVFDKNDRIYVLELSVGNDFPAPEAGRIVRIDPNGTQEVIATGFTFPTDMAYGPDGNLYVLTWGFGGAEGAGQVMKVTLHD